MFTQPWASYFLGHARNPNGHVYVNVEWPNGNRKLVCFVAPFQEIYILTDQGR